MKNPVAMTRALPKFNWILLMMREECAKFIENCGCMNLIWVWWWVENLSGCMNWVCDNNDFEISLWFVAWLIPHLIANSSASVLVMLTAWWRVFMTGLLWMCVCNIDVAMLFLILASVIISTHEGILKDSKAKLSSYWIQALKLVSLHLLNKWKEKQLERVLMTWWLGENLGWRGSNKGCTSLNLLSISTNKLLISSRWHFVSVPSESKWQPLTEPVLDSMRD